MITLMIIICSLNLATSLAILIWVYDFAKNKGYEEGYNFGFQRGRKTGYSEGYIKGMKAVYFKTEEED